MGFDIEGFFDEAESMLIEKKSKKEELLIDAKNDLEIAKAKFKVIKAKKRYEGLRG